jgi:hypothetical protein
MLRINLTVGKTAMSLSEGGGDPSVNTPAARPRTLTAAQAQPVESAATYEFRTTHLVRGEGDPVSAEPKPVRVTCAYTAASPQAAMAQFAADHPEYAVFGWWRDRMLTVVIPGQGEPPRRHLKNCERDPDAEAGDGWLTNMRAGISNVEDHLNWEPEFRHGITWRIPCPACTGDLFEITGKFGAFYRCRSCEFKASATTRKAKAAEAQAAVVRWCGTRLVLMINRNGIGYGGCPACHPGYKSPIVNDTYYGRSRP